jgi:hypothetical protein
VLQQRARALGPRPEPLDARPPQVNKYPRVRRCAAELLYTWAEFIQPSAAAAAAAEGVAAGSWAGRAQEALEGAVWDGSVDVAKAARDQVAQVMGVEVAAAKKPPAGAKLKAATRPGVRDENASYQSLIDDFARGFGF